MNTTILSVVLLVPIILFGCSKKEQPVQPPPSSAPMPAVSPVAIVDLNLIARGRDLYSSISGKNIYTKIDVWGTGFPTAKICLWISEDDWGDLSANDKEALIEYLKSKIPEVRADASRYVDIPRTAPVYNMILKNVRGISDGKYIVFTMRQDGGSWVQNRTVAEK